MLPLGIRTGYYFENGLEDWRKGMIRRALYKIDKAFNRNKRYTYVKVPTIEMTDSIHNWHREYRRLGSGRRMMSMLSALQYIGEHYIKERWQANYRADFNDHEMWLEN